MNDNSDNQLYSIEAVARMQRCLVDPDTFLKVRPQPSLKTVSSLNRRLRTGPFPGAIKLPGSRQWSIDLVTHDREVNKMLEASVVAQEVIDAGKSKIPSELAALVSSDKVMEKVLQKLVNA